MLFKSQSPLQRVKYYYCFYASKNNNVYTSSYLRNQSTSIQKSPIQQAVEDSYIAMEKLQENKSHELQDQEQPEN